MIFGGEAGEEAAAAMTSFHGTRFLLPVVTAPLTCHFSSTNAISCAKHVSCQNYASNENSNVLQEQRGFKMPTIIFLLFQLFIFYYSSES